jgi:hypothetical protein|tara:strand:- start:228 stop:377 length:150 start_codon:yes stop_codon:yes gene_type:complete
MHQEKHILDEEKNIYHETGVKEALEKDEISIEEEGFMQGYYEENKEVST